MRWYDNKQWLKINDYIVSGIPVIKQATQQTTIVTGETASVNLQGAPVGAAIGFGT